MGNIAVWKVLEEMIADFREKGLDIPTEIMNDLISARTTLKILNVEPPNLETLQRIDQYMMKVESYLVSEGQNNLGFAYVDKWLNRLDEARKEKDDKDQDKTRFIPGVPRQKKWIRVTPTAEITIQNLEATADGLGLKCTVQKDGSLLICGEGQSIKDFVKKMASKYKADAEKYRKKVHNG
jgi:hypothetical protein